MGEFETNYVAVSIDSKSVSKLTDCFPKLFFLDNRHLTPTNALQNGPFVAMIENLSWVRPIDN